MPDKLHADQGRAVHAPEAAKETAARGEEFKATGLAAQERGEELSYSDFCLKKLTEAGLEFEQLVLATALIDLGIAIGQIQMLAELAKERRIMHEYLIGSSHHWFLPDIRAVACKRSIKNRGA